MLRLLTETFFRVAAGAIVAVLSLSLVTPALAVSATAAPLLAFSARIAGDDARTRLIIDFDRKPDFKVHYVANPYRVLIDLPETAFGLKAEELEARGIFSDIRYGTMAAGRSRIVLTASRPVGVVLAEVQEEQGAASYRLVIDTAIVTDQAFQALMEKQSWQEAAAPASAEQTPVMLPGSRADGPFVIAVDAGHGGIDNGARGGVTKTEEKHVTLAFARQLTEALNALPGTRAILTRDKDEFLSLSQRVQLARNEGANLLISIHADTLKQKDIRGATVYTISDKASDSLAASLAERENLSDQIAGISFVDEPAEVADILLDLTRRETQAFSINLAQSIVSNFKDQVLLINNPHRHAGFRVLTAPDVPSILLELGFMSNKDDEKLLVDPAWQKKVAGLVAKAVEQYRSTVVANGG
ncbi:MULTISPECIES: N-acetylmuramoyl-L-alanine amidase [unclassified Shinella]|jgi:N-acetylmuramoyl-L-alanine amidase|uniref:N-acetylmuramoyl-L-alanine amidase n=1 Tax=unclassified Shinella TaxID=2643062 RepID=UPI0003C55C2E|nr:MULTISPECIES: N-acetylmuramoyl-L-alanine amidase [unclassified Shinella]EYR82292.1 N-acetylmuramoyl-L-alanine amidase AmiB [Shinella sp. DD12]KNY18375.1 N-acetylmuramoyl-L-alanine amidase [Shinella sp. SUS2]KOC77571.1 N-acetylmuramoyl-L-alanine amidase [Shinella sp. GWS1]MCO5155053.1 N-acetylmuramoyl-L-alanine amidase [Shinella sp.]MDC7261721.1 N-acetylmuramoyl-L-alanine amidase [Shinella sp. HY16]